MTFFLAAVSAALLHSPSLEICGHEAMLRAAFAHGLAPTLSKPLAVRKREGLTETDVLSNSLQVEPNFTNSSLAGTNTMVVRSLSDGLNQFHVRLGNNFALSSVTLDGRPVTATFEDSS